MSSIKSKTEVKPRIKCPECGSSSAAILGYSYYEDRYSCEACHHYFTVKRPHLQSGQGSRDKNRDKMYQQARRRTKKVRRISKRTP